MNFGYITTDFSAVGQVAWKVYKSYKDAPKSFRNISHKALSLHATIKDFEDDTTGSTLTAAQQAGLQTVGDGCRNVLQDSESLIAEYQSLGTKSKGTWDRMGWGMKDITESRARLTSNTILLTAFIK